MLSPTWEREKACHGCEGVKADELRAGKLSASLYQFAGVGRSWPALILSADDGDATGKSGFALSNAILIN